LQISVDFQWDTDIPLDPGGGSTEDKSVVLSACKCHSGDHPSTHPDLLGERGVPEKSTYPGATRGSEVEDLIEGRGRSNLTSEMTLQSLLS
jgi:hypothetical protein